MRSSEHLTSETVSAERAYLVASDFDGTIADTFEAKPGGLGVLENYELTIGQVFGEPGLTAYKKVGGLKNRAPSELVSELVAADPCLIEEAHSFYASALQQPRIDIVGDGDTLLMWDYEKPEQTISELIVRQKLGNILSQIDNGWPALLPGFKNFWERLRQLNDIGSQALNPFRINTAVISSGHTRFIAKTFFEHGLSQPDILVTEDDIRSRHQPAELDRRVKPGTLPLALAHQQWLARYGATKGGFDIDQSMAARDRMVYLGDDLVKDGGMAERSKVSFVLFGPQEGANGIADWRQIAEILESHEDALQKGQSITDIFAAQYE